MANILFNELSASATANNLADTLQVFASDIKLIKELGVDRVVFHTGEYEHLVSIFLDEKKNYYEVANTLDKDTKSLIVYFLSSTRNLEATNTNHTEESTKKTVNYLSSYLALPMRISSVSFRSEKAWNKWNLNFIGSGATGNYTVSLNHLAPLPSGLKIRSHTLLKFILSLPEEIFLNAKAVDVLPYSSLSSFYYTKIDGEYKKEKLENSINANIIVGSAVAEINGYQRCQQVEKLNRSKDKIRHIFYNAQLETYLSIDVMHGAFEVCSKDGSHLREINFLGAHLSKSSTDHSIKVK